MNPKYCIKIGGSLMKDISQLSVFLEKLITIFGASFVVIVGSGYLGDVYKTWLTENCVIEIPYKLSVFNWSMIQKINAHIISSLNQHYLVVSSSEEIEKALYSGKCAIIDPVYYTEELSVIGLNTSDLKAAYLCNKFNCKELIIFTDVNGIYTDDPKAFLSAKKYLSITPEELGSLGKTSLDIGTELLLKKYHIQCRVCGVKEFLTDEVLDINDINKCGTLISEDYTYVEN